MPEYQAMRNAFEAVYGELSNEEMPSKSFLGAKNEEVESNEPKAESLKEVTNKEDWEEDYLSSQILPTGHIAVRRTSMSRAMPSDPEELRAKWKLLAVE